jgi:diguanylate cyclase (GGDEF)-like protein/PAS domain S-box-containing protein
MATRSAKKPKQSPAATLRTLARARAVTAASHKALVRASDQTQLLQDVCRIMVDEGGYSMAWAGLVRFDEESSIERVAFAGGDESYFAGRRTSWADNEFGQGPTGLAVRTRKPQVVRNIRTDRRFKLWRDSALKHGFVSAATLPLVFGTVVVGVFGILDKKPQAFGREEVDLLLELASDIAYGYCNLGLRDAQRATELRLRKLDRARRVMVECNRALSRAADEGALLADICRILLAQGGYHAAWLGIVQHDEARTFRIAAHEGFPPGYFDNAIVHWGEGTGPGYGPAGRAVRTGRRQLESNIDISRGRIRWHVERESATGSVLVMPLMEDGRAVAVLGVLTGDREVFDDDEIRLLEQLCEDISRGRLDLRGRELQRIAEEKVAESERRLKANFEHAPIGINHIAPGGRILLANAAFERILGYGPGELTGRNIREFLMGDDPGFERRVLAERARLHSGETDRVVTEIRYRRKDGTPVWTEVTIALMRDADGHPLYDLSSVVEISERKRAEAELRRGEERYRRLTELISEWYWEQDENYRLTVIQNHTAQAAALNPVAQRNLGKAQWEMGYLNMTEADWAAYRARLDARESFRDLRLMRVGHGGVPIWLSMSGHPVLDAAGVFTGYRGITLDITEEVRAEQIQNLEHAVAAVLARAEGAAAGIVAVIRILCEVDAWDCGRFGELDEASGLLRFEQGWSVPDPEIGSFLDGGLRMEFRPGSGLVGLAWDSGNPLWSEDLADDGRVSRPELAQQAGVHGAFAIPVSSGAQRIGVIALFSRQSRKPDERILRAARAIGSQLGQFLHRKRAELALQESVGHIRRQAQQQRLIADLGREALAGSAVQEVLDQAVRLVKETLQADICDVLELEASGETMRIKAASGWPAEWPAVPVPVRPGTQAAYALAQNAPLIIDYRTETRFKIGRLGETGMVSGLQVPIQGPTRLFGLLGLYTREHRPFGEDDASFMTSIANILAVAIERRDAEDRLSHLARYDALTGLPNRRLFQDRLVQAMAQARRNDWLMAVLFIDLDRFKLVNDTLGHAVGDKLLVEAAARLNTCVRTSDTVGRLGGDEFAAILSDLARPGDAGIVAQKIVEALARPFQLALGTSNHETFVSASIGITVFPNDGDEAGALIMNADAAMYRAKDQGRNNYQYFTPEMNERAIARVQLENQLRRALEKEELLLEYQPRIDLRSGAICGFEALLRWRHPERGIIAPGEFIPALEDMGLIVPVGEWVMQRACRQMVEWQKAGVSVPPVAVNLSARQFQQKDLEASVSRILRDTGIDPALLQVEITESLLMQDPEGAARTLRGLRDSGVKLSVDDFGTGYSSLSYLKRFPIHALKIDRGFVRDIASDPDDAAIARAIINLAHSLGLSVVAEGVETAEQLGFLVAHGCDEMQGFYFSPAVSPAECESMLRESRRLRLGGGGMLGVTEELAGRRTA